MTTDLQEAFREAARREFAMVPDESELDYTFSPDFQRKMQRIIRAQVHGYWNMVNTLGKRIAIAAAIIVMLLTTAMAIKPIRERVIKFFVEVYEDYFEIHFGEEVNGDLNPTPIPMKRYYLSELPEGYREVEYIESEHILWTHWQNGNGDSISLQQENGTHEITIDHTVSGLNSINHPTLQITCQNNITSKCFIWEQDGYVFFLTIYENLPTDQIIIMIDSLIAKK